jgi:plastocyanin
MAMKVAMNFGMRRRYAWLALVAGVGLGASQTQGDAAPQRVPVAADGVQRVTLVGGSYYFEPEHIVVQAGVPVELRARRERGITPHNLVIRSSRMGLDIEEGLDTEETVIRFTPEVPGRVVFYCDERLLFLPSHRDRGMSGVLEVVE